MGTHFGFVPHFLKSNGFTCVDSTNSFKEAGDNLEELKTIWNMLDINPIDLHVSPNIKDLHYQKNMMLSL